MMKDDYAAVIERQAYPPLGIEASAMIRVASVALLVSIPAESKPLVAGALAGLRDHITDPAAEYALAFFLSELAWAVRSES